VSYMPHMVGPERKCRLPLKTMPGMSDRHAVWPFPGVIAFAVLARADALIATAMTFP